MIHVFQRLRRRFLDNNRFSKYLLYAIGEILLVVIGILIALQVNNWNEGRKEKHLLNDHFLAIISNVKSDIQQLEKDAILRDSLRATNIKARNQIKEGLFDIETLTNSSRFFFEFYFTPNKSGYEALKNSGYMGKITNTRIDSLLHGYYVGLDNLREREISFNVFIENVEYDYRTKFSPLRISLLMGKDSLTQIEKNELLESYKSNYFQAGILRTSRQGTSLYYRLIENGKELIKELENNFNE
ncbi:DUF6090 family protein [Aegicerativicinus sediminis]|uniref:DUF6090 family protein n=1 Tax=Aegicerativicinus sediminis TaxID=2893202 RepID=UPI001E485F62|nr:DUF6090 family protein [Aegicerativicinus sediminis]